MSDTIPTAKDLMNPAVRTVYANQDIEDVEFCMKMASFHHLPVLDDDQKLVGVVSERDIAYALADKTKARTPISSIMQSDVITVPPTMPADEIISLMIEKRIGCVPVLDTAGTIAGILTETDFLHLALAHVREKSHHYGEGTGYHR